jgi:signal transduction histidine kinase
VAGILWLVSNFDIVVDAPLKMVFFAIMLIGSGGTLIQVAQGNIIGNYAGPIRLSFVGGLMIVPALVYRAVIIDMERDLAESQKVARQALAQKARQAVFPAEPNRPAEIVQPAHERESAQLLRAMGMILEKANVGDLPKHIVRTTIDVFDIDVCVLLKQKDANYVDVIAAYDRRFDRPISGVVINLDQQPTLASCMEGLLQGTLSPGQHDDEIDDFLMRLDIRTSGPIYFQPVIHDGEQIAVLVIALPHTNRTLLETEKELLGGMGIIAGNLLAFSYTATLSANVSEVAGEHVVELTLGNMTADDLEMQSDTVSTISEVQQDLRETRGEVQELNEEIGGLLHTLDQERGKLLSDLGDTEEGLTISQRMLALNIDQHNLREERDDLSSRVQVAGAALYGALIIDDETLLTDTVVIVKQEKHALQAERDLLKKQIEELQANDGVPQLGDAKDLTSEMSKSNHRLQQERDQLSAKLHEIQSRLEMAGIKEGESGLIKVFDRLVEQRASLTGKNTALENERGRLLEERQQFGERMRQEEERETRLKLLEEELENVAADRETALKQRDKFRAEVVDLKDQLDSIKGHRTRLLAQTSAFEEEVKELREEQTSWKQQAWEINNQRSDLIGEKDRIFAEKQSIEVKYNDLLAREGSGVSQPDGDVGGVDNLRVMVEELTERRNQLEHELSGIQVAYTAVLNDLEVLRSQKNDPAEINNYHPQSSDLLLGLVQELRTPMTSITGYVDLLLGESAGILGEMQRKFMQRVSTNISRLDSMLNDLIRITELDTGSKTFEAVSVDVTSMIDDAITNASNQFREKGLTVNINFEDSIPSINADRDAVEQTIGQLLTNAYLVSPPNSEISVSVYSGLVEMDQNNSADGNVNCLCVLVEDRGGGIDQEDAARVFARKYKAENPLIQGLGDTGVGLSVAKALVEAQGGRLWVETKKNIGCVFVFALPL